MKRITKCIFIYLILLAPILSFGQQYWSLEKCILHSLESNIIINQAQLSVANAEINHNQSRQARYPSLNANSNVNLNFGRSINPTSNEFITESFFSNNYGINSNVTLFNGFRISKSIQQSELELKAAIEDREQTKSDIALQVANSFLQVLFAKENIDISRKQLELSKQQLDQINKFIAAGARPESERLNLEAQITGSEQALINSENTLEISMLQLKQLLRLPPDEDMEITIPENINVTTDPDLIAFDEAFTLAQSNRPDLRAGELRNRSADIGIDIAKGNYYPSLGVGGSLNTAYSNRDFFNNNYVTQLDNNLSYGVGAQLSIPIYNQGNVKSNVERAKLNLENAKLTYEQIIESLKTNVQQAIANARASKKQLEASEKTVQAQKLAFDNTTKRLEIGAANTFEWESQKTQMENAEISRLIDKYTYLFNIKILEFYLGKPLKL